MLLIVHLLSMARLDYGCVTAGYQYLSRIDEGYGKAKVRAVGSIKRELAMHALAVDVQTTHNCRMQRLPQQAFHNSSKKLASRS